MTGSRAPRRKPTSVPAARRHPTPVSYPAGRTTFGGQLYAWEFEKDGRELRVRVEGQLVFSNLALRMKAALAGLGLAYLPEGQVQAHLAYGRLFRVLADWCPPFSGYHLYYPS